MNSDKNIEQKLETLADALGTRDSFVSDVMTRIENPPVQPGNVAEASSFGDKTGKPTHVLRRILMKKTVKLTAAAVILIAAFLSLTLIDTTVTPAYALEHTIQACHSVCFIHIRQIDPKHEDEPILIWAEFFENGHPKRIRVNLPEWQGEGDGPKEILWEDNAATVWFKEKNGVTRFPEQNIADRILNMVREQDPKTHIQHLLDAQKEGKVEITIDQPSDKAEPICVTAILLPDRTSKYILYVDQSTQLLLTSESYVLADNNDYILTNTIEFCNYNQPIAPAIFAFDNLPEDVLRVDQVNQQIGLVQGDLTDDQAAIETARCFWQAVIEEDFDKAGQYLEGVPGDFIKKHLIEKMQVRIIEIVSVGPVQPHPNPGTRGVIVPTRLKVEKNGQIEEITFNRLGVRQVYNQPGRWTIFGGL